MRKVLFVQRMIPDYRLPVFRRLREKLKKIGVDFYVTTGESLAEDCLNDSVDETGWILRHKNWYIAGKVHLHRISDLGSYDLVVVMQENAALDNYYLLIRRRVAGKPLVAFFGHGRNVNTRGNRIREEFKKRVSLMPDWWFAYTALSKRIVEKNGYPEAKITIVNNAIDDEALKAAVKNVSSSEKTALRKALGIRGEATVALYCGRLIDIKVTMLIEALEKVRESNKGFEAIVIGKGPLAEKVRKAAKRHTWLHYVGAVYGDERAKYFCISDMFVMPGMVGLAILDAFATGLPVITTDCKVHSPEIEYLENGVNGIMTEDSLGAYVRQIYELTQNQDKLSQLKTGARGSADKYSVDRMANNFVEGIESLLASKGSGRFPNRGREGISYKRNS